MVLKPMLLGLALACAALALWAAENSAPSPVPVVTLLPPAPVADEPVSAPASPAPIVADTPVVRTSIAPLTVTRTIPTGATVGRAPGSSVWMEELTWPEIRSAIKDGKTTVIIPTGGTEQNGPHIVLGKHNMILRYTAMTIAQRLGNALVAPIVPYVPEGGFSPPSGNMRFPGTMMVRDETFAAMLEDIATSLKLAGFKTICFVGEHGGSQGVQREVAEKLTALWKDEHIRVIHVSEYYDEHNGQNAWLSAHGITDPDPQAHGGLADTSEMLAAAPGGVREKLRGAYKASDWDGLGVEGPSDKASRALGMELVELKVRGAVSQIQRLTH